jgi:threonyl-tRNA synthetase
VTVQVDFVLPARFELKYRASDGQDHRPVMIHRALAGSLERFFGILIEHYGGAFPVWLAPIQVVVTAISQDQVAYAHEVGAFLEKAGFRVEVDESNEKLGYKIRHWKTQKVPYILVAGKQEVSDGTVNVNERGVDEKRTVVVGAFVEELQKVVEAKK